MRLSPLLLILTGLCLVVCGFVYDLIFAGIPYQDPTPEMSMKYERHAHIASTIRWSGLMVMLFGGASAIYRHFGQRSPRREDK